jgi:DNA-binding transcriptional MerR regulator
VEIVTHLLAGDIEISGIAMKRKEVSEYLDITMDTLRNWEMNGLLRVRRKENGYRVYSGDDIRRLKIIRSLKCANYSLESILRMLNALSTGRPVNIRKVLNTPGEEDDIISVCDRLILSLCRAEQNANEMIGMITEMKRNTHNHTLYHQTSAGMYSFDERQEVLRMKDVIIAEQLAKSYVICLR